MRSCPRTNELLDVMADGAPLPATLSEHVARCGECASAASVARRVDARLDAEMTDLVTDALPPTTVAVARATPASTRRRVSGGVVLGAIATAALTAFAVVGIVVTGISIADAARGIGAGSPSASAEPVVVETLDCYLGEPADDGVVDASLDRSTRVAYCLGELADDSSSGGAVTCLQPDDSRLPSPRADAYFEACTRVVEVEMRDDVPAPAGTLQRVPSVPYRSWDEASAAVAWPVMRPEWLPDGYDLAALQGFGGLTVPEDIESVVASYLRNGVLLSIDQFFIADPASFRVELTLAGESLSDVTTGRTTIGDLAAFWADGVAVESPVGMGIDRSALLLTWSDGQQGYRITGRNVDLDTLRRIAESLTGDESLTGE